MKWHGSEPIVIGEADTDGNVVNKITINPGDEIPEEWQEKVANAGKFVDLIPCKKATDMREVQDFYRKQKEKAH